MYVASSSTVQKLFCLNSAMVTLLSLLLMHDSSSDRQIQSTANTTVNCANYRNSRSWRNSLRSSVRTTHCFRCHSPPLPSGRIYKHSVQRTGARRLEHHRTTLHPAFTYSSIDSPATFDSGVKREMLPWLFASTSVCVNPSHLIFLFRQSGAACSVIRFVLRDKVGDCRAASYRPVHYSCSLLVLFNAFSTASSTSFVPVSRASGTALR